MRKSAWVLLLLFAFAIPWEYSLDLGGLLGNAARIAGLLVLAFAVPAVLQAGRMRTPGAFWWFTLALFLWLCCTYFWTIDPVATLEKIRGYFQEMMIVWLVWEFADTPADLRALLRATVAGSWVLALLTLAAFSSPEAVAAGQIRFAAYGQDPNEVARFLDLGFPLAALLVNCERRWPPRLMALGFFPLGIVAVLLTASREGFLAAIIGIAGSIVLLTRGRARRAVAAVFILPPSLAALWFIVPPGTLARLATIPEQLQAGDLNQRLNIWSAGWRAFARAPLLGTGAGSFVAAARLSPIDTAHNTALSIAVCGGLCALFLASILLALAVHYAFRTHGPLRMAFVTSLIAWALTSLAATVEENRTTWLLLAMIAVAGRLAADDPGGLADCFSARPLLSARGSRIRQPCGGVTHHVTL
jgi:O-antigen ligase